MYTFYNYFFINKNICKNYIIFLTLECAIYEILYSKDMLQTMENRAN